MDVVPQDRRIFIQKIIQVSKVVQLSIFQINQFGAVFFQQIQIMRRYNDGFSPAPFRFKKGKEIFRILRVKSGGRLV